MCLSVYLGEPIKTNLSCYEMAAEQCTTEYTIVVDNSNEHSLDQFYLYLLDFIQGTVSSWWNK